MKTTNLWAKTFSRACLSNVRSCQHYLRLPGSVFEIYLATILVPENKIGVFHLFHLFHFSAHSVSPVEDVQPQNKPSEGREEKSRARGSKIRPGQQSNKLFASTKVTLNVSGWILELFGCLLFALREMLHHLDVTALPWVLSSQAHNLRPYSSTTPYYKLTTKYQ